MTLKNTFKYLLIIALCIFSIMIFEKFQNYTLVEVHSYDSLTDIYDSGDEDKKQSENKLHYKKCLTEFMLSNYISGKCLEDIVFDYSNGDISTRLEALKSVYTSGNELFKDDSGVDNCYLIQDNEIYVQPKCLENKDQYGSEYEKFKEILNSAQKRIEENKSCNKSSIIKTRDYTFQKLDC